MAIHLMRELQNLKKLSLTMAAMVEENLRLAVKSARERNEPLARKVIEADHEIDRQEVAVEEECLKILALYQPVANDLRFVVAMIKINHDLERIGDLAVNIAERAIVLAQRPPLTRDYDLKTLADAALHMVSRSLDALINQDAQLAREIWLSDDTVDNLNRKLLDEVEEDLAARPNELRSLLALTSISRTLERIADHATNISKDVIYMIEGDIVRHRSRFLRAQAPAPSA
ncbi:MAG: phosphate signaling complex protein PhoU [Kiritimatiellae bacterium]|nr:phosphate signaling complex protein PhoU [Kiritimatiellia bacterium]MDW8458493.1 phosphate signaling complex protein PhoU [Verrucomicrobiota bacterium]